MIYCLRSILLLIGCCLMLSSISAQEWEQKSNLPGTGRDHPVGFAINDTGYVVAGSGIPSFSYTTLDDFYRYIPESDEWEQLADFPGDARGYSIGIAHQGKGYIGFGDGPNGLLDDLWEYDPKTNEWTELAPCPCSGRQHPVLEASEGKIYVGLGNDQRNLNDWWQYSIDSNSWTQLPDLPGPPRHHPYHFSINGKVYAGLGHGSQLINGSNIYDDWYEYSPEDTAWTQMNDFPGEPRVAGTQFAHNGKGYVLSGDGLNHEPLDTGEFWTYNPVNDEWRELSPHPGNVSYWAPTNFVANGEVYLMGGFNKQSENLLDSLFSYDLSQSSSVNNPMKANRSLTIYPNPARENINFPDDFTPQAVEIVNTNGQILKSESTNENSVKVADLSPGLYLLRAKDEKGNWHQSRFLKR